MNTKNLVILVAVAAALSAAAVWRGGASRRSAPALNGRRILPAFSLADVAKIDAGGVTVAASDEGWVVQSMQNYPADRAKIVENLGKLQELKVGQVVRGRPLASKTDVALRDAEGRTLASVILGDKHPKWGFGRYMEFEGETVLVSDALDAFDGDPKRWCDTKIADTPWISFTALADADVSDDVTGLSTGVVAKVTVGGDTNRVATVGNALPDGGGRYFRLEGSPWTFIVPSYSVERLLPKPETETAPAPEPAPAPEAAAEPAQEPEPAPAPEPEAVAEPTPEPESAPEA